MGKETYKRGYEPREGWPFATPYDDGEEAVKKAPKKVIEEADRLNKDKPRTCPCLSPYI